jgi:anti-sigma regulatory factor (Ser/Thr protein kinase)
VRSLTHTALLYRDDAAYLDGTVPFVLDAVQAGVPSLVAVPPRQGDLVRRELGRAATGVRFLDMTIDGRNPARIIPAVLHAFISEHAGDPVAIIEEATWAERSAAEYPACVQHEALINVAFEREPAAVLCAYNTRELEPHALADAARTHPMLITGGRAQPSRMYAEPDKVVAAFNEPLSEPPDDAAMFAFSLVEDLAPLREFVAIKADATGLASDRIVDLQIAANELASNTLRHTAGPGVAHLWSAANHVICQISDGGHITDPLAGRIPPALHADPGRGLLLTNYLCDLVRIHTAPGDTTVRVYMRIG